MTDEKKNNEDNNGNIELDIKQIIKVKKVNKKNKKKLYQEKNNIFMQNIYLIQL